MIQQRTVAEARRQGNNDFDVSEQELKAFIGLCIIRGVVKGRDEPLPSLWEQNYGRSIFRETMSRNNFHDKLRYLRFDDKTTRPSRRQHDKFTAIRELWETVMTNCQKVYHPHESLTIDEQLFPCKSRCSFIQYMKSLASNFG